MPNRVIVRCSQGALYSTIWTPFMSIKAVRIGFRRLQWCPVHRRFEMATRVNPASLTQAEQDQALATPDSNLP